LWKGRLLFDGRDDVGKGPEGDYPKLRSVAMGKLDETGG
jgi:hypothetical protein